MANHKSAEKRYRQSERRRQRNVATKSHVRTRVKTVLASVTSKDEDKSREELLKAVKVIDKAAGKGVLHKNTASRKISRLTRKVNALSGSAG
ncbi:MAG TPA: 30S ribosomal protein S20 [Deltaproteobacteria bacterium]|nr:30S ribosomal protein S20 [Deltaproteobacteria bacterium]